MFTLSAAHGCRGLIVDLDTNRAVPKVIRFNPANGVIEAYQVEGGTWYWLDGCWNLRDGKIKEDATGNLLTYIAQGRFKYVPRRQGTGLPGTPARLLGAAACARCGNPLVLPGDDLCCPCRAKERGQTNRMVVEYLANPLLDRKCQWRSAGGQTCGRLAVFSVGDEVPVSPQQTRKPLTLPGGRVLANPLWERAATVGRHYYCAWHYSPPRILDARGEVMEKLDNDPIRP